MSVKYNVDTQTLMFQSPASNELCLHVRVLSASTSAWTSQLHCTALSSGAVKLHDNVDNVNAVEVSFCVQRRTDVCGPAHNATIGQYSQLALLFLSFCLVLQIIHRLLNSFAKIAFIQCDQYSAKFKVMSD